MEKEKMISRRKLLATIGLTGAAVATGSVIPGMDGQVSANPNRDAEQNVYRYENHLPERTVADKLRESVSVKDFGAVGDGITDDTQAFLNTIQYATMNSFSIYVPNPAVEYIINDTLYFDEGMKVFGESRAKTILNFSGLPAGKFAIAIAQNTPVVNFQLGDMTLNGTDSVHALKLGFDRTTSVVDCAFHNMRIYGFNIGIQSTYSWQNLFQSIRVQSCVKPLQLDSQTNATHFDSCSFVTYSATMTFKNCEGLLFSNANISNISANIGMSLFQSNVVINNPYFEYPGYEGSDDVLFSFGTSSDVIPNQLVINGGIVAGKFRFNSSGHSLYINGSRISGVGINVLNKDDVAPTIYTRNMIIQINDRFYQPNNELIFSYDHNEKPNFRGAYGGSDLSQTMLRDYAELTQTVYGNGIQVYNGLVAGEQYTLALAVRDGIEGGSDALGIRFDSNQSLGIGNTIQGYGEDFEYRYVPFISSGTLMRLMFSGKLQVKSIRIYKGIRNTDLELIDYKEYYNTAQPTHGEWSRGDRVINSEPLVGRPKAWTCVAAGAPGTWVSEGDL